MPQISEKKKQRRNKKTEVTPKSKVEYPDRDNSQFLGCVEKKLGSGRFILKCEDGIERIGKIRNNMHKRVWVDKDNVVIYTTRDFESNDNKVDIIHRYTHDELKQLARDPGERDTIYRMIGEIKEETKQIDFNLEESDDIDVDNI